MELTADRGAQSLPPESIMRAAGATLLSGKPKLHVLGTQARQGWDVVDAGRRSVADHIRQTARRKHGVREDRLIAAPSYR
jgi:hypothetical protein